MAKATDQLAIPGRRTPPYVFSYLDKLIEKHENPKPRKIIGFKPPDKNKD